MPVADAVIAHGYDAIDAVLRDPAFRVTDAARLDEVDPGWRDHPALGMNAILNTNPPDHSRIRAPMARAFTKRRVSGLGPSITRMTDELLDLMAERGAGGSPVEFMHDFAFLLPVTVICELLGIPEADRAGFRPLARDLAATVEVGVDLPVLQAADKAAVRLHEYLLALAAERRADPRDDLVSVLVAIADPDGTGPEAADGAGDGAARVLERGRTARQPDPAAGGRLRDDHEPARQRAAGDPAAAGRRARRSGTGRSRCPRSWRKCCATTPRCSSPAAGAPTPSTWAACPCRRHRGHHLAGRGQPGPAPVHRAGHVRPAAAGRRDAQLRRGRALLPGAALARLEGAIAFPRLLRRFPRLAAAGEPTRRTGLVLRGFETLPVTLA